MLTPAFSAHSLPANSTGVYQRKIYCGLAQGINSLNDAPTRPGMRMLSGLGRAYPGSLHGAPFYASSIHDFSIDEDDLEHKTLMDLMAQMPQIFEGAVYMGCAGHMNLSYIAAMKPAAAILYDINPLQTLYWRHALKGMAMCPNADDFSDYLRFAPVALEPQIVQACGGKVYLTPSSIRILEPYPFLPNVTHMFRTDVHYDRKTGDPTIPESRWRREGYTHLHAMAKADAIAALTLDLTDAQGWAQLEGQLNTFGLRVNVMYTSNALRFMDEGVDWTHGARGFDCADAARANFKRVAAPFMALIDDGGCADLREQLRVILSADQLREQTARGGVLGQARGGVAPA